jgi:hypothetical protein
VWSRRDPREVFKTKQRIVVAAPSMAVSATVDGKTVVLDTSILPRDNERQPGALLAGDAWDPSWRWTAFPEEP